MLRQISLIRLIFEFLSGCDQTWVEQRVVLQALSGHEKSNRRLDVLKYHIDLCLQAGLLIREQQDPPPFRLQVTWAGHEFLTSNSQELPEAHRNAN